MKLGAEPKKVAIFVGLIVVAGIVYWMNSPSSEPAPVARPANDPSAAVIAPVVARTSDRRSAKGVDSLGEAVFKLPDRVDPSKVDPTLRLDLLAKLQSIQLEGGVRFIFQIGQPPPDPVVEAAANAKIPNVHPLHPNDPAGAAGGAAASNDGPKPTLPPPPPTTPPINLKYYGYSTKRSDGERKAFFLDGDDIIVAAEGEIIKKQYKILRISPTGVQMEDTASKSTQTLPLQPEAAPA